MAGEDKTAGGGVASGNRPADAAPGAGHTPKVSVLVPIYNVEEYLPACLESLANQQGDYEFICLNDGSTDGSPAIVETFAERDPRIVLVNKANSGYGATLNRGLDEARGEFIAILESDDVMYEGALEKLLLIAEHNHAEVVKGIYSFWWPTEGRETLQCEVPQAYLGKVLAPREHEFSYLLKPTDWSCLYRASFLRQNSIRFLETPGAAFQDASFMFKVLMSAQRAVFCGVPVVHYRQDRSSSSVNSSSKAYAVCTEYDEIERWVGERASDTNDGMLEQGFIVAKLNAYLWNLDRLSDSLAAEFIQRCAQEFRAYDASVRIDWKALGPWRATNLRALMNDPQRYLRLRQRWRGTSPLQKARFALHLAGPKGLADALLAQRRG